MELRKRVKPRGPEHHLQDAPPKETSSSKTGDKKRSEFSPQEGREEVSLLRGSSSFSGSGILLQRPWRQCVSLATGLLLAVVLGVTQAWCVNAIHENLLWFAQLTVRDEILFESEPFT